MASKALRLKPPPIPTKSKLVQAFSQQQEPCDSELYDDIVSIKKYSTDANQNLTTENTDKNVSMLNFSEAVSIQKLEMKPKPQPKPRNSGDKVTITRLKPLPKPRTLHAARKVTVAHKKKPKPLPKPQVAAQESENVEHCFNTKKPPIPTPTLATTQDDDIYDDVVVYRTKSKHSCEPPVAPEQLLHEDESLPEQNPLSFGAVSEQAEYLYTDASSLSYPRVCTISREHKLEPGYEQGQHYQTEDGPNISEVQSPQGYTYSQPHQDCRLSVDRPRDNVQPTVTSTENISTPTSYIYPSLSPQALRRSQQQQHLQYEYDYACADIGLSMDSVTSASDIEQISSSEGVFARRNYDYAYQLQSSPSSRQVSDSEKGNPDHKYYYIRNPSEGFDIDSFNSNSRHSYDTICDVRRIELPEPEDPPIHLAIGNTEAEATASRPRHYQSVKTEGQQEMSPFSRATSSVNSDVSVRMKFDPLPDVPHLQLSNSEESEARLILYEDIDPQPYEQPHFKLLPNKIRQQTIQLVRGPNKKKLHLNHRKSTRRPSILDVGADQAQFSTQTPKDSCQSDDDYDTIPNEEVYDMLLEDSGIHHSLSVPISTVRRHSVSSPESREELLQSLSSNVVEKRFLETNRLGDLVYSNLNNAGIIDVDVSSRTKIVKELEELMQGAQLSPPIIRPRSRLVSKMDQRLLHRFRRTGSM